MSLQSFVPVTHCHHSWMSCTLFLILVNSYGRACLSQTLISYRSWIIRVTVMNKHLVTIYMMSASSEAAFQVTQVLISKRDWLSLSAIIKKLPVFLLHQHLLSPPENHKFPLLLLWFPNQKTEKTPTFPSPASCDPYNSQTTSEYPIAQLLVLTED